MKENQNEIIKDNTLVRQQKITIFLFDFGIC